MSDQLVVLFSGLLQTSYLAATVVFTVVVSALLIVTYSSYIRDYILPLHGKRLPPGLLGLPFIGETISFLKAQKKDKTNEWVHSRMDEHGPIFKTSVIGSNVVALTGNKFMLNGGDNGIASCWIVIR